MTAFDWQCPTCGRWVCTGGDPAEAVCYGCALGAYKRANPPCDRCEVRWPWEDLDAGGLCPWCIEDLDEQRDEQRDEHAGNACGKTVH